jgi:hypothetical protein
MAAANSLFADAVALALRLSPLDKVRLLEQVASTLERDLTAQPSGQSSEEQSWGQRLVALVDQLDLHGWDANGDEDPVEWVARQRQDEMNERQTDWSDQP